MARAPLAPSSGEPSADPFGEPFAGVLLDMDGTLLDSIAAMFFMEMGW